MTSVRCSFVTGSSVRFGKNMPQSDSLDMNFNELCIRIDNKKFAYKQKICDIFKE